MDLPKQGDTESAAGTVTPAKQPWYLSLACGLTAGLIICIVTAPIWMFTLGNMLMPLTSRGNTHISLARIRGTELYADIDLQQYGDDLNLLVIQRPSVFRGSSTKAVKAALQSGGMHLLIDNELLKVLKHYKLGYDMETEATPDQHYYWNHGHGGCIFKAVVPSTWPAAADLSLALEIAPGEYTICPISH